MGKISTLRVLSVCAMLVWAVCANAQVSTYAFTQSSGTYTPLTGGILVIPQTAATGTGGLDDVITTIPAGTSPFTFFFDGIGYTGLSLSTNGFITFGGTAAATNYYSAISGTTAYNGAIAAFSRDIQGGFTFTATRTSGSTTLTAVSSIDGLKVGQTISGTGIATGATIVSLSAGTIEMSAAATSAGTAGTVTGWTGEIRIDTVGTAPNREVVIQYSGFKCFGTTLGNVKDMYLNFQIRLQETTNRIQFVYGPCSPGTITADAAPQVGLRGPNNTYPANVNNRLVNTTNDWATSLPGVGNGSTCRFVSTAPATFPASGQIYQWTPPTCYSPTNLYATNISTDTASLRWKTPTVVTPANYEWQVVAVPGTIGSVPVASGVLLPTDSIINVTGLNPATPYRFFIRSICSPGDTSGWAGPLEFTTACPASVMAPYCQSFENNGTIPGCWAQGAGNAEPWRFSNTGSGNHIGNNAVITGTTSSNGYFAWVDDSSPNSLNTTLESPFIDVSTLTDPLLQFYLLSNNEGFTNVFFRVSVFDGANWVDSFYTHNTNTVGGWELMNVPLGGLTITGPIKLRFIVNESNGTDFYDDVAIDDVCVIETPLCAAPTAVSLQSATDVTATIQWTSTGVASKIEYGADGFTPGTGTVVDGLTSPYTITGLSASTSYDVYVTDSCSGGFLSPAVGPISFSTLCAPQPYPGDAYASALLVNTYPFNDTISTADSCVTDASSLRVGKDVFYRFVADSCASEITFSLCGSSFDNYLYILDSTGTTTLYSEDDVCGTSAEITFTPTPGTTYIAVIEPFSSSGVTGTVVVNVTQVEEMPVITSSFTSPSCAGIADGSAGVTVTAYGVLPVTYLWSTGGTNDTIDNITSGTYYVTVTTGCGTVVDTVVVPATFNVTVASVTDVSCNGGNNGAIDITVANGTTPYTFLWSNGSTDEDLTGLSAGAYCVTVSESGSCVATVCATVNQPAALAIAETVTDVLCNGGTTGAVDITVTGGTIPSATGTLTTLFAQNNGCTNGNMFNLQVNNAVSITSFDINYSATGPVTIYYKTGNYAGFETNASAWTQIFTGTITGQGVNAQTPVVLGAPLALVPGAYAFYVNADLDYTDMAVGTTYSNPDMTLTVGAGFCTAFSGPIAGRAWNGNINYSATGNYVFNWSTSATTEDVTGLAAGPVSVTVTDDNNCTASETYTITEPTALVAIPDSINNVSCNGLSDGGLYLTLMGGTPPYSYLWSNGDTTQDLMNVPAGLYTGTVTDDNGCTLTSPQPVPITEPAVLAIAFTSVDSVSCNGANDGAIDITVTGGTPGYVYDWSNNATTADISGLSPATYTVDVVDTNGCTATGSAVITEPDPLMLMWDSTINSLCNGDSHGGIYVSTMGGTTPYTFAWSNSSSNEDLTQVQAGAYTLNLTDANGCTATLTDTIEQPDAIVAALDSVDNATCNGANNGAVYVTVTGGTGNIDYDWSNNATTQNITGLGGGTYDLTATDANGCTVAFSQAVTEPAVLAVTSDSTDNVACFGGTNGGVFISVTGGTTPYDYDWSNNATTADLTGVGPGSYTATVTDANGCTVATTAATVTQPAAALTATSTATGQIQGGALGSINVTPAGGTTPYSYAWSNSTTQQDLAAVAAGVYTLTITDANGCTATLRDTVDLVIGIEEIAGGYTVSMYPNPTTAEFTVDVTLPAADNVNVVVYTLTGQVVSRATETDVVQTKVNINLGDQAEGVYVARITVGNQTITKRVIVAR